MVKNLLVPLAALLLTAGCEKRAPKGPEPLQGIVEYDDRTIGFELGGRVMSVEVERGAEVAQGAVLVRLDATLEAPLESLRAAEVESARAQLGLLEAGTRVEEVRAADAELSSLRAREAIVQKNLQRQRTLLAQNALAASVVDDTEAELTGTSDRRRALEERLKALKRGARSEELAAGRARVQAATAALDAQRARLSRYVLYSPVDGNALDVHVKVGEMVAPGAPAITLADLSHPYVDVFVPEARMPEVRMGQSVTVRVDGMKGTMPGKVEHVYTRTEFTPRYLFSATERPNLVIRVRVRIEDSAKTLHAGVPAFVTPGAATTSSAPARMPAAPEAKPTAPEAAQVTPTGSPT